MKQNVLVPIAIAALSSMLRLYDLGAAPPGLFQDEAANGLVVYEIIRHGTVSGNPASLYIMIAQGLQGLIPIAILGLSPLAVRLPYAFYGIGTTLAVYLLARSMFDRRVALISSVFTAITPWDIELGRVALSNSPSVFWFLIGLWMLYEGLKRRSFLFRLSAVPITIAGFYFYAYMYVFMVLFLGGAALLSFSVLKPLKRDIVIWLIVSAIVLTPALLPTSYQAFAVSPARGFLTNSVFVTGSAEDALSKFLANYLTYLSPNFLFLHGDANLRQHVGAVGELMLVEGILLVPALLVLIRKRTLEGRILLYWFFLASVPASLTLYDNPGSIKTMVMSPAVHVICGSFLSMITRIQSTRFLRIPRFKFAVPYSYLKGILLVGLTLLATGNFVQFMTYYYGPYQAIAAPWFEYGFKQVSDYLIANDLANRQIFFHAKYAGPFPLIPWAVGVQFQFYSKNQIRNLVFFNELGPGTFNGREPGALFVVTQTSDLILLQSYTIPCKEMLSVTFPSGDFALILCGLG